MRAFPHLFGERLRMAAAAQQQHHGEAMAMSRMQRPGFPPRHRGPMGPMGIPQRLPHPGMAQRMRPPGPHTVVCI